MAAVCQSCKHSWSFGKVVALPAVDFMDAVITAIGKQDCPKCGDTRILFSISQSERN